MTEPRPETVRWLESVKESRRAAEAALDDWLRTWATEPTGQWDRRGTFTWDHIRHAFLHGFMRGRGFEGIE